MTDERNAPFNASAKAITNIKWLSSVLRGFSSLADELGEAADIQQYISAKKSEMETIEREHREFTEKVAADVLAAEATAAEKIKVATKKADEVIAKAAEHKKQADAMQEKIKEMRSGAQAKADALIAGAEMDAKRLVGAANDKISSLNVSIERLVNQEAKLLLAVSEAQGRLDDIVGKMADLKSKL